MTEREIHPAFRLEKKIRDAQRWYEETGEPTVVYIVRQGYDYSLQNGISKDIVQVMKIPQGWVN